MIGHAVRSQLLPDVIGCATIGLHRRYERSHPRRPRADRPTLSGMRREIPAVLSIAGSDSGGGAGIQADLKAFAACGVHGMTAITALTAQNTLGVTGVHAVPGDFIVEQVRAVAEDIGVDAVKVGMLGTSAIVAAVDAALDLIEPGAPVVIDPVMVAESGAVLLDDDARGALVDTLLPRATVITPNLPEARVLAGANPPDDVEELARALHALGPDVVVITGGHREETTDVLFDGDAIHLIPGERHPDGAAHGSGCTHSSALAAHLAHGRSPLQAARAARAIAAAAVRDGLRDLGRGPGPVDVLGLTARGADRTYDAQITRV
jgi:hydroxymethylpyrimidine/phosphomethylpyrimidine kinase